MKFYYSYEDKGVTRVLTMDRRQHFFVQLVNRLPVEIPAGVINNPEPVKAKYIMYDYKNKAYIYEAGRTRHACPSHSTRRFSTAQCQVGGHGRPQRPVHLTHMADGSSDTVMNRLFNDLAAKAVSNKSYIVEFLPQRAPRAHQANEGVDGKAPARLREGAVRVEAIRSQLFEEFAAGQRQKDTIEDACRKEALRGFRALVAEKRVAMPPERGLSIIENAADVINRKFGAMYQSKADEFAKAGTARALYRKKVEPFHSVFKSLTAKHNGFLNITAALEELGPANRTAFDALLLDVERSDGGSWWPSGHLGGDLLGRRYSKSYGPQLRPGRHPRRRVLHWARGPSEEQPGVRGVLEKTPPSWHQTPCRSQTA